MKITMPLYLMRAGLMLWVTGIFYASLAPSDSLHPPFWLMFPHSDKAIHLAMYFGFAFLLYYSLFFKTARGRWIEFLICFFTGIFIELCQEIGTISRSGDFYDALTNGAGAGLGLLAAIAIPINVVANKKG